MSSQPHSREVEMVDVIESQQGGQIIDSTGRDGHVTAMVSAEQSTKMSLNTEPETETSSSKLREVSTPAVNLSYKGQSISDGSSPKVVQGQQTSSIASPHTSSKRPQPESVPLGSEQINLNNDKARVQEVISDVSPEAVQQVLRENWRLFLFDGYNENHISFIVRAGLKNANISVLEKILKDDAIFKEPFQHLASQKPAIIGRVLKNATVAQLSKSLPTSVLDKMVEEQFKNATVAQLSNLFPISVLDKMVEERIKNAPAKDLINWLAGGDRLGFRRDDTLDESDESVVPNIPIRTQTQPPINYETVPAQHQQPNYRAPILPPPHSLPSTHAIPPAYRDPLLLEQEKNKAAQDAASFHAAEARKTQFDAKAGKKSGPKEDLVCKHCNTRLPTQSGYNFHVWKKVCQDSKHTDGRWVCDNCFSHFLGKQGLVYHSLRDVCKKNISIAPDSLDEQGREVTNPSLTEPPPQHATKANPATILPPRPPMHSAPVSTLSQNSTSLMNPETSVPRLPAATGPQRPPMHTPSTKKGEAEYRMSPADLSPAKLAAMNKEILEEDEKFHKKINGLPRNLTEAERVSRITGFKNANATRKSQIRKSYGVSLRLRDKDKKLRAAAEATPSSSNGRLEEFRAPPSSKPIRPPQANGAGFSPINTPSSSAPVVATGIAYNPSSNTKYGKPPSNAADRTHNPMSFHPDTLTHALETRASSSGFGVLKTSNPSHIPPMNYQQVHQTNKRRRTSEGTSSPGTGYSSPFAPAPSSQHHASGLAMIRSEDAAAKYAKKANTQKRSTSARQSNVASPDTAMTGVTPSKNVSVVLPSLAGVGTKESAYNIVDSSEDDDDADIPATSTVVEAQNDVDENMDTPLPSIESPPGSRSSLKARRGGKH